MLKKGLIQVYTGNSEYFNFAPYGLSLRAAGHDFRILIACLAPHELMDVCSLASSLLKPNLVIDHSAIERTQSSKKLRKDKALNSFQKARQVAVGGEFDLVILNGIFEVLSQGVITLEDVISLMEDKPENVELVLCGSGASKKIIEKADLVTEMVVVKPKCSEHKENGQEGHGTIEVITGEGKGKTTYCLGKAMLMSCKGITALVLQVIKSPRSYGEVMAIEKLPNLQIKTMGEGFLDKHGESFNKKHKEAAKRAWEYWLREIYSLKYGLLVLDEINIATHYGLIRSERVQEMLFLKPEKLHLLLSGRHAHPSVTEAASTVIEMKEIKHPFHKGIRARKGIEF